MSFRIPSRRLAQPALTSIHRPQRIYWARRRCLTTTLRRTKEPTDLASSASPSNTKDAESPSTGISPILEKLIAAERASDKKLSQAQPPRPRETTLPPSSIFYNPAADIPKPGKHASPEEKERYKKAQAQVKAYDEKRTSRRDKELEALRLDPDPEARKRYERKMVIRAIRRRGRLTREEKLMRTERTSTYKSPELATSVKKLTRLMHQIAGKTVEEALVQLRFSKKKVALDVYKGLETAKYEAMLSRGMGLGGAKEVVKANDDEENKLDVSKDEKEVASPKTEVIQTSSGKEIDVEEDVDEDEEFDELDEEVEEASATPAIALAKKRKDLIIELKNGKRHAVADPSTIYVDQAWVNKGIPGKSLEYRARGRVNVLTHPSTSFSVVLKEEATRIRISDEIKKKRANKKVWTALPDRPITTQRQYCLW